MQFNTTRGSLEVRIKASDSFANALGERDRTTNTNEHTAATATAERGIDEVVKAFGEIRTSRGQGDARGEVHPIKRVGGRTRIEHRDAKTCDSALGNERCEQWDHGGQRG